MAQAANSQRLVVPAGAAATAGSTAPEDPVIVPVDAAGTTRPSRAAKDIIVIKLEFAGPAGAATGEDAIVIEAITVPCECAREASRRQSNSSQGCYRHPGQRAPGESQAVRALHRFAPFPPQRDAYESCRLRRAVYSQYSAQSTPAEAANVCFCYPTLV